MKKLNLLTLAFATGAMLASPAVIRAGVIGTPHDFSGETWNTKASDQHTVCSVCHTPHHADPNAGPLWNHANTGSGGFTMYNNANSPGANVQFSPVPTQPAASSLACLSCHDGTVAVNSYGGTPSSGSSLVSITNSANLTKDLSHSHPISFDYNSTLVSKDKWIWPTDKTVTPPNSGGGAFVSGNDMSINGFLLGGKNRLECSSCHDVHNQEGSPFDIINNPKLVKIVGVDADLNGSLLCRACHNK